MGVIARTIKSGGSTNVQEGQTALPGDLNDDMNSLFTLANGEIDDGNIKTAEMPGSKSFRFTEISDPSNPTSDDVLAYGSDEGGISVLQTQDSGGKMLALGKHTILGAATGSGGRGGAVGMIHVDTDGASTGADTNETTLFTYTLPANALSADGMGLRIRFRGATAANANTKRFRVYFGATEFFDTGALALNNDIVIIEGAVWRVSATAQYADGVGWAGEVGGGAVSANFIDAAVASETLSGAVIVKVTGTNGTAAANDIMSATYSIEVLHVV